MSSYTPNNLCVYVYALAGYQAGAIAARAQPYDPNEADYVDAAERADAFAQAVDQAWGQARTRKPIFFKFRVLRRRCGFQVDRL